MANKRRKFSGSFKAKVALAAVKGDQRMAQTPFCGVPRMTQWLRCQGHRVNEKRLRRLLRQMGLEAIYPRRMQGLSQADRPHQALGYRTPAQVYVAYAGRGGSLAPAACSRAMDPPKESVILV